MYPNAGEIEIDIENYRPDEFIAIVRTAANGFQFILIYSTRSYNVVESVLNLARTVFVTVVLFIAAIHFIRDANRLVLNPIERMLRKVRYIAKNPLAAANDDVDQASLGVMQMIHNGDDKDLKDKNMETVILERAITRIGHLLALGFGEAGASIIA